MTRPASASARAARVLDHWRANAGDWCADVLGEPLMDLQVPIFEFLSHPTARRLAIASGNSLGKTNAMAKANLYWPSTRRGLAVSTAPNRTLLKTKLWAETARLYRGSAAPLGGEFLADGARWKIEPKWGAYGLVARDESGFQGEHAPSLLVLFDEAQAVDAKFWTAAEGMMSSENAKWIVVGNPLEAKGAFYSAFRKRHLWQTLHLSAFDHPNVQQRRLVVPGAVTWQWVEEMRELWGEEDPRYVARVLGRFPDTAGDRVVPLGTLEKAVEAWQDSLEPPEPGEGPHLGVDVARYGTDETVIAVAIDGIIERVITKASMNGPEVAGLVIRAARKYGVPQDRSRERIHVDETGVGASVVDALSEAGWPCDAVAFSEKPRGDWRDLLGDMEFANLRAELYWTTRERVRVGSLLIPESYGEAWEELTEPGYSFPRGRLQVEDKESVRRRLGRSPDTADAIVLTQARGHRNRTGVIVA